MRLTEKLDNQHELVGVSLGDGRVEVTSVSPEGGETLIGIYKPEEQVNYQEDILGNHKLTKAVGRLLRKFARRWQ